MQRKTDTALGFMAEQQVERQLLSQLSQGAEETSAQKHQEAGGVEAYNYRDECENKYGSPKVKRLFGNEKRPGDASSGQRLQEQQYSDEQRREPHSYLKQLQLQGQIQSDQQHLQDHPEKVIKGADCKIQSSGAGTNPVIGETVAKTPGLSGARPQKGIFLVCKGTQDDLPVTRISPSFQSMEQQRQREEQEVKLNVQKATLTRSLYARQHAKVVRACEVVEAGLLALCVESKKRAPCVKEATERALLHVHDYRDKAEATLRVLGEAAVTFVGVAAEEIAAAEAADAVLYAFPAQEVLLAASHAVRAQSFKLSLLALSLLQRLLTHNQQQLLLCPAAAVDRVVHPLAPVDSWCMSTYHTQGEQSSTLRTLTARDATAGGKNATSACFSSLSKENGGHSAVADILLLLAVLEEMLVLQQQGTAEVQKLQLKVLQTALLLLAPDARVIADVAVAHRVLRLFASIYRSSSGSTNGTAYASSSASVPTSGGCATGSSLHAGGSTGAAAAPSPGSAIVAQTACAGMMQLLTCLTDAAVAEANASSAAALAKGAKQCSPENSSRAKCFPAMSKSKRAAVLLVQTSHILRTAPWRLPVDVLLQVPTSVNETYVPQTQQWEYNFLHGHQQQLAARNQQHFVAVPDGGDESQLCKPDVAERSQGAAAENAGTYLGQQTMKESSKSSSSSSSAGPLATLQQVLRRLALSCLSNSSASGSQCASANATLCTQSSQQEGRVASEIRRRGAQVEVGIAGDVEAGRRGAAFVAARYSACMVLHQQHRFTNNALGSVLATSRADIFSDGFSSIVDAKSSNLQQTQHGYAGVGSSDLIIPKGIVLQMIRFCVERAPQLFVQSTEMMAVLKLHIFPALYEIVVLHAFDSGTVCRTLHLLVLLLNYYGPLLHAEFAALLPLLLRRSEADASLWQRAVVFEVLHAVCRSPQLTFLMHAGTGLVTALLCNVNENGTAGLYTKQRNRTQADRDVLDEAAATFNSRNSPRFAGKTSRQRDFHNVSSMTTAANAVWACNIIRLNSPPQRSMIHDQQPSQPQRPVIQQEQVSACRSGCAVMKEDVQACLAGSIVDALCKAVHQLCFTLTQVNTQQLKLPAAARNSQPAWWWPPPPPRVTTPDGSAVLNVCISRCVLPLMLPADALLLLAAAGAVAGAAISAADDIESDAALTSKDAYVSSTKHSLTSTGPAASVLGDFLNTRTTSQTSLFSRKQIRTCNSANGSSLHACAAGGKSTQVTRLCATAGAAVLAGVVRASTAQSGASIVLAAGAADQRKHVDRVAVPGCASLHDWRTPAIDSCFGGHYRWLLAGASEMSSCIAAAGGHQQQHHLPAIQHLQPAGVAGLALDSLLAYVHSLYVIAFEDSCSCGDSCKDEDSESSFADSSCGSDVCTGSGGSDSDRGLQNSSKSKKENGSAKSRSCAGSLTQGNSGDCSNSDESRLSAHTYITRTLPYLLPQQRCMMTPLTEKQAACQAMLRATWGSLVSAFTLVLSELSSGIAAGTFTVNGSGGAAPPRIRSEKLSCTCSSTTNGDNSASSSSSTGCTTSAVSAAATEQHEERHLVQLLQAVFQALQNLVCLCGVFDLEAAGHAVLLCVVRFAVMISKTTSPLSPVRQRLLPGPGASRWWEHVQGFFSGSEKHIQSRSISSNVNAAAAGSTGGRPDVPLIPSAVLCGAAAAARSARDLLRDSSSNSRKSSNKGCMSIRYQDRGRVQGDMHFGDVVVHEREGSTLPAFDINSLASVEFGIPCVCGSFPDKQEPLRQQLQLPHQRTGLAVRREGCDHADSCRMLTSKHSFVSSGSTSGDVASAAATANVQQQHLLRLAIPTFACSALLSICSIYGSLLSLRSWASALGALQALYTVLARWGLQRTPFTAADTSAPHIYPSSIALFVPPTSFHSKQEHLLQNVMHFMWQQQKYIPQAWEETQGRQHPWNTELKRPDAERQVTDGPCDMAAAAQSAASDSSTVLPRTSLTSSSTTHAPPFNSCYSSARKDTAGGTTEADIQQEQREGRFELLRSMQDLQLWLCFRVASVAAKENEHLDLTAADGSIMLYGRRDQTISGGAESVNVRQNSSAADIAADSHMHGESVYSFVFSPCHYCLAAARPAFRKSGCGGGGFESIGFFQKGSAPLRSGVPSKREPGSSAAQQHPLIAGDEVVEQSEAGDVLNAQSIVLWLDAAAPPPTSSLLQHEDVLLRLSSSLSMLFEVTAASLSDEGLAAFAGALSESEARQLQEHSLASQQQPADFQVFDTYTHKEPVARLREKKFSPACSDAIKVITTASLREKADATSAISSEIAVAGQLARTAAATTSTGANLSNQERLHLNGASALPEANASTATECGDSIALINVNAGGAADMSTHEHCAVHTISKRAPGCCICCLAPRTATASQSCITAALLETSWARAEARASDEDVTDFYGGKLIEVLLVNVFRIEILTTRDCGLLPFAAILSAARSGGNDSSSIESRAAAVTLLFIALEALLLSLHKRSRTRRDVGDIYSCVATSSPDIPAADQEPEAQQRTRLVKGQTEFTCMSQQEVDQRQGKNYVGEGDISNSFGESKQLRKEGDGQEAHEQENSAKGRKLETNVEEARLQIILVAPLCMLTRSAYAEVRLRALLALQRLITRRGELLSSLAWEPILRSLGWATQQQLGGSFSVLLHRMYAMLREDTVRHQQFFLEGFDSDREEQERRTEKRPQYIFAKNQTQGYQQDEQEREQSQKEWNYFLQNSPHDLQEWQQYDRANEDAPVDASPGDSICLPGTSAEATKALLHIREMKALYAVIELIVQDFAEELPLSRGWRMLAACIAAFGGCPNNLGESLAFQAVGLLWTLADSLGRRRRRLFFVEQLQGHEQQHQQALEKTSILLKNQQQALQQAGNRQQGVQDGNSKEPTQQECARLQDQHFCKEKRCFSCRMCGRQTMRELHSALLGASSDSFPCCAWDLFGMNDCLCTWLSFPSCSSSVAEEFAAIEACRQQIFLHLRLLASDARPEVRNCALRSLTSAARTPGLLCTPPSRRYLLAAVATRNSGSGVHSEQSQQIHNQTQQHQQQEEFIGFGRESELLRWQDDETDGNNDEGGAQPLRLSQSITKNEERKDGAEGQKEHSSNAFEMQPKSCAFTRDWRWETCGLQIVTDTLADVHAAYVFVTAQHEEPQQQQHPEKAAAADSRAGRPKELWLVHHSRDSPAKQWSETLVVALDGMLMLLVSCGAAAAAQEAALGHSKTTSGSNSRYIEKSGRDNVFHGEDLMWIRRASLAIAQSSCALLSLVESALTNIYAATEVQVTSAKTLGELMSLPQAHLLINARTGEQSHPMSIWMRGWSVYWTFTMHLLKVQQERKQPQQRLQKQQNPQLQHNPVDNNVVWQNRETLPDCVAEVVVASAVKALCTYRDESSESCGSDGETTVHKSAGVETLLVAQLIFVLLTNPVYVRRHGRRLRLASYEDYDGETLVARRIQKNEKTAYLDYDTPPSFLSLFMLLRPIRLQTPSHRAATSTMEDHTSAALRAAMAAALNLSPLLAGEDSLVEELLHFSFMCVGPALSLPPVMSTATTPDRVVLTAGPVATSDAAATRASAAYEETGICSESWLLRANRCRELRQSAAVHLTAGLQPVPATGQQQALLQQSEPNSALLILSPACQREIYGDIRRSTRSSLGSHNLPMLFDQSPRCSAESATAAELGGTFLRPHAYANCGCMPSASAAAVSTGRLAGCFSRSEASESPIPTNPFDPEVEKKDESFSLQQQCSDFKVYEELEHGGRFTCVPQRTDSMCANHSVTYAAAQTITPGGFAFRPPQSCFSSTRDGMLSPQEPRDSISSATRISSNTGFLAARSEEEMLQQYVVLHMSIAPFLPPLSASSSGIRKSATQVSFAPSDAESDSGVKRQSHSLRETCKETIRRLQMSPLALQQQLCEEKVLQQLQQGQPLQCPLRAPSVVPKLVDAMLQLLPPNPIQQPEAFRLIFPLLVREIFAAFLLDEMFVRDTTSLAIGCRALTLLQCLYRKAIIAIIWGQYTAHQLQQSQQQQQPQVEQQQQCCQHLCREEQPNNHARQRFQGQQQQRQQQLQEAGSKLRHQKQQHKQIQHQLDARGSFEKSVGSERAAEQLPQTSLFCKGSNKSFSCIDTSHNRACSSRIVASAHTEESSENLMEEVASDSCPIASPPNDRNRNTSALFAESLRETSDSCSSADTLTKRGDSPPALFNNECFAASDDAALFAEGGTCSWTECGTDTSKMRDSPIGGAVCAFWNETHPMGVILLTLRYVLRHFGRMSTQLRLLQLHNEQLQVWQLSLQAVCLLVEDVAACISHHECTSHSAKPYATLGTADALQSSTAPEEVAAQCSAAGLTPRERGSVPASSYHNGRRREEGLLECFWAEVAHALKQFTATLFHPHFHGEHFGAVCEKASSSSEKRQWSDEHQHEQQRNFLHCGLRSCVPIGAGRSDGFRPSESFVPLSTAASFFGHWFHRLAKEALTNYMWKCPPQVFPAFVAVLDDLCSAAGNGQPALSHKVFCTLFNLCEMKESLRSGSNSEVSDGCSRYSRISNSSGGSHGSSASDLLTSKGPNGEARAERTAVLQIDRDLLASRRLQCMVPVVLRRCKLILQHIAAEAKAAAKVLPLHEYKQRQHRAQVSALHSPQEAQKFIHTRTSYQRQQQEIRQMETRQHKSMDSFEGRSQLLSFILSRLKDLKIPVVAFEGQNETAESARCPMRSRNNSKGIVEHCRAASEMRLNGPVHSSENTALNDLTAELCERRMNALRAAGTKSHLLLLMPELVELIECDDRLIRCKVQAALRALPEELGLLEPTRAAVTPAQSHDNSK